MSTNIHECFDFPFCDDISKYEKLMKVGQGTFGEVYKASDRKTRKLVALKKVLMDNEREGFPITSIRELKILKVLNHENIVNLLEVCNSKESRGKLVFYLVFEFCEHDLAGLLASPQVRFTIGEIKKIMQMLLNALYFLHFNRILHRDLKTANILMSKHGILKLTDFGLARAVYPSTDSKHLRYTNRVVTLWYRPPELLLGDRNYTAAIDMWGTGCIMAEVWTRSPIMQGRNEQHQLNLISKLCGTIDKNVWENVENLEFFDKMVLQKNLKRSVREKLEPYIKDSNAIDLVDKLLTLDPAKRFDADSALNHDFFWTNPMPADLRANMSKINSSLFELYTPRRNVINKQCGGGHQRNDSHTYAKAKGNTGIFDRVF